MYPLCAFRLCVRNEVLLSDDAGLWRGPCLWNVWTEQPATMPRQCRTKGPAAAGLTIDNARLVASRHPHRAKIISYRHSSVKIWRSHRCSNWGSRLCQKRGVAVSRREEDVRLHSSNPAVPARPLFPSGFFFVASSHVTYKPSVQVSSASRLYHLNI